MATARSGLLAMGFSGALAAAVTLGGCNFHAFGGDVDVILTEMDQPWKSPQARAGMQAWVRWDFVKSYSEVHWRTTRGDKVDAFGLARRCDALFPREFRPRREGKPGCEPPRYDREEYDDTRVIVSVDPPVVVVVPVASATAIAGGDVVAHGPYAFFKLAWGSVILPFGYQFGTRVPYHPEVRWFVPVEPAVMHEAEVIDDQHQRIDLGMVRFAMRREGDIWVVRPEKTDPSRDTRIEPAEELYR